MEERTDVMTDYQMQAIFDLIIGLLEENLDNPQKAIDMLKMIREGKKTRQDKPGK